MFGISRSHLRHWPLIALLAAVGAHGLRQQPLDAAETSPVELVAACIRPAERARTSMDCIALRLEVARSQTAWERGLMFREALPDNGGMLFIFPRTTYHQIWMRGMEMPIDVLFISAEHEIVSIRTHLPPCTTPQCTVYAPSEPVRYVLEVPAGFVDRYTVGVGDRVEWTTGPESLPD